MLSTVIELLYIILLPVGLFLFLRRRTGASPFPLGVGYMTYMVVSWIRALFRMLMVYDGSVSAIIWSAMLSGVLEELGRYFAFRKVLVSYTQPKDAMSYGIGHSACEIILSTGMIMLNEFLTAVQTGSEDMIGTLDIFGMIPTGMLSHIALSVLVYISVNYRDSRKYLYIAAGIHTASDIISGLSAKYLLDISFLLYYALEIILAAAVVWYARRVYKEMDG